MNVFNKSTDIDQLGAGEEEINSLTLVSNDSTNISLMSSLERYCFRHLQD